MNNKKIRASVVLMLVAIVAIVFAACKTEATPDTKTWTVTVDPNGGEGLTRTSYTVDDGKTLDALEGTPTIYRKYISGYKIKDGGVFTLGSTAVDKDITIIAQWAWSEFTCTTTLDTIFNYAKTGNRDGLSCLIKNSADINQKNANDLGFFPLSYAAQNQKVDAVKYLVQLGADVNLGDDNGTTALMQAAVTGNLAITQYLLSKNSNINAVNAYNKSALMVAIEFSYLYQSTIKTDAIKYLINYPGVDLNLRAMNSPSAKNQTALGIAKTNVLQGYTEFQPIVDALVAAGAKE